MERADRQITETTVKRLNAVLAAESEETPLTHISESVTFTERSSEDNHESNDGESASELVPSRSIEGAPISADELFQTFANERCRYVLYCLDRYRTPMALADLADEVALLEHDADTLLEVSEEDVKRIYCDLYHAQIPQLVEVHLVEYDQERDTVSLRYDISDLKLSEIV